MRQQRACMCRSTTSASARTACRYLRQLPAAELKIDASFVQDIEFNDARLALHRRCVVKLAHALGLRVVAEGVETEGQRDLLVQLGCDELQGYLFAKPMSAKALGLWALTDDSAGTGAPSQEFRASLFEQTQPMVPPDMK
jgi:predicted signal transduction protein with EAL and GGDEF domain